MTAPETSGSWSYDQEQKLAVLIYRIREVDPTLPNDLVRGIVADLTARPQQRTLLVGHFDRCPDLLSSGDTRIPTLGLAHGGRGRTGRGSASPAGAGAPAHVFIRMATHSAIDRLRTHCADDDLAFGLLADLPALEASQPSLALLGIAADARQRGAIDGPAIETFLLQSGHRGVNELDPTAPVWETQRSDLEAMIWRMAAADPENPVETGRATRAAALGRLRSLTAMRRQRVTADARFARWLSVVGERSKSDVARHVNQLRRALTALRERLHPQIDPGLTAMLSWHELRSATLGLSPVPATLDARRQALMSAVPPIGPSRETRKRMVLNGVAASPGTAAGTAVVIHDPIADTDIDAGDILIAHATDTSWTPLFLGKAAIVTDTGGVVSHASIVARDFGIPAVVGTGNATTVIRTGDQTHVDGDAGHVEIIR